MSLFRLKRSDCLVILFHCHSWIFLLKNACDFSRPTCDLAAIKRETRKSKFQMRRFFLSDEICGKYLTLFKKSGESESKNQKTIALGLNSFICTSVFVFSVCKDVSFDSSQKITVRLCGIFFNDLIFILFVESQFWHTTSLFVSKRSSA